MRTVSHLFLAPMLILALLGCKAPEEQGIAADHQGDKDPGRGGALAAPSNKRDDAEAYYDEAIELATVCLGELCGYINNQGEWQIQPKFRAADPFSKDGLAKVIVTDGFFKSGVYLPSHGGLRSDMAYSGSMGLIDVCGNFVLQPEFGDIKSFADNGLAAVKMNSPESKESGSAFDRSYKWGFANTKGQLVIDATFDAVENFSNDGLAAARLNNRWGFIDDSGQWVILPQFDNVKPFLNSGLALAREYKYDEPSFEWPSPRPIGKFGFIDSSGQWVVAPIFDRVKDIRDTGLVIAVVNGKSGLINTSGQWVVEPEFWEIWLPKDGNQGQVITATQLSALLGTSGSTLLSGEEGDITIETSQWLAAFSKRIYRPFADSNDQGLTKVKLNGKFGMTNTDGKWTIKPKFDQLQVEPYNGLFAAGIKDRWGLIDLEGKWVVKPKFDRLLFFSDKNLSYAQINDKLGVIDATGQWILEPQFSNFILSPRIGNVAEVEINHGAHVRCYLDYNSAAYRTGADRNVEEPGFRWEFANGTRTLFNRHGKKILTVEDAGRVARNAAGEIIWPLNGPPENE